MDTRTSEEPARAVPSLVDSAVYRDGSRAESPATLEEALRSLPDETSWAWIGLYRPSETELLAVAEQF
jgi:magnesium transporter